VILNVHHYDELFADPDAHRDRFAAFWLQIAERFRNADNMVWFELLNEPHDRITDANLLSILNPALANVRASNPTRPVVIGGQNFSGINSLATLPLPNDPNIIATFHYYDPFDFTHQGASFLPNPPAVGRVFGNTQDMAEVNSSVSKARAFMTRTGVPVFMGEYGAIQTIPTANRALYYKTVTDAFRAANVDGCVWGYISTFNFREDAVGGAWDAAMLDAIGL
jgi:endoglucanase